MRRPEIRWQHENRRSYYEGLSKTHSYPYSLSEDKTLTKTSLDSILFTIIKGLLACLAIVVILATFCSAALSTEKTGKRLRINSYTEQNCSRSKGGGFYGVSHSGVPRETNISSRPTSPESEDSGLSDEQGNCQTDKPVNHSPCVIQWR